jgi:phage protein D
MTSDLPAPQFRPTLKVLYPALDSHRLPIDAQIRLCAGEHAVAQLTILTPVTADRTVLEQSVPSSMIIPDGAAVHLTYGSSGADSYDFYGYVASHRQLHTQAVSHLPGITTLPVQYTLTGASYVMQSATSRTYLSATASSIARQVAAANQLAVYTTACPRLFPAKTQAAQSDFTFLQDLARQVGFQCWVDNSLLYFVDPAVSLTPVGASAPLFRRDAHPGVWDTLSAFHATTGETDPSGAYLTAHTVSTLRSASGQLATAKATPLRTAPSGSSVPAFTRVVTGSVASSYAEAVSVATASAANHRYWVAASATVDGHTALRPGRTVNLAGDALTGAESGAWRITSAVHRITLDPVTALRNTYHTDLELGRDQENALTLSTPRPAAPPPGAMLLLGGRWRAASYGGTS